MIRLIGVVMVCFSSAMIGFRASTAVKTRLAVLGSMVNALDLMIAEISCLLTPVQEILEKLVAHTEEPIRRFFYQCLTQFEQNTDTPFSSAWKKTLEEADYLCLTAEDRAMLSEIGNTFGRYTGEDQVRVLKGIRTEIESSQKSVCAESAKTGRLYRSLGITCGIALVILLI